MADNIQAHGDALSDDLTGHYLRSASGAAAASSVIEADNWLRQYEAGGKVPASAQLQAVDLGKAPESEELPPMPKPKPQRTSSDELGRPDTADSSVAGTVARNISELPTQAIGGVDDAARHALGFLDPMTNWLNENVADLRYDPVKAPKSGMGAVTRSVSEFLTGFVPALKALRAAGATGKIAPSMLAGAVADFSVRDPHAGRLFDLWKEHKLPQNVLTEFLASNPQDTEAEARFKNTLEGAGLGVAFEGVVMGAKMLRAARSTKGAHEAEVEHLRARYGEVSDDNFRALGDPKAPVFSEAARKLTKAERAVTLVKFDTQRAVDVKDGAAYGPQYQKHAGIQQALQSGDEVRFVEKDGKITAAVSFKEKEGVIHVSELGSLGEGNGGKLLGEIEQTAARSGSKVTVNAALDAVAFYKKRGYVETGGKRKAGTATVPMELPTNKTVLDPRSLIRGRKGEPLPDDFEVYVNFARIDEPDQVKFVIGKMAEKMKGQIDDATRGVQTEKQTEQLAEEMGLSVTELLSRRRGQTWNAETTLAARKLWAASGEKLLELAKIANGKNAGEIDLFNFRKMMTTHAAIQAEVIGARTETARALASWKIPAGGGIEKARAIELAMGAVGGHGNTKELARRLSILADAGASPAVIGQFAERGWAATSVDMIREIFVNGLLSSPKTHVVNVTSNTLVAFQQIYERAAAGAIRGITGGEGGVHPGEAMAMAFGVIESYKDAFRLAAKSLKTGETGWALGKMDMPRENAVAAFGNKSLEAFRMSRESGAGRFVDFLGTAANVPGRLLGAEDEFFKTIGYRMELRAQALRQAHSEGFRGKDLAQRVAEIVERPPEHVRINAADAALYQTFTNETGAIGKWIMKGRNIDSPLNPAILILPFVRTPINIARYAFERTPLAPLVGQWRDDIAAGGARADLALARMSTGTAIMLTALDMADSGMVSGRGPMNPDKDVREAMQRQNWQPYSVKVGDRWYSYNRTDPFGMTMGFAADIAEAIKKGELDDDDVDEWQEVLAMTVAAVSQVAISKTYLQGFAEFVEVATDPKRYTKDYVMDLTASFVPFTALNYAIKGAVDPVIREAETPMQAIQARIAGLSSRLPPRRTLWGEIMRSESGLGKIYDFASPVASREQRNSPVDREIVRLGDGPQRITKRNVFDGVDVNMRQWPKVYDDYTRLAGNETKDPAWGLGAKDYLDAVVTGKHPNSAIYQMLSDDSKKEFITKAVTRYRRMAQQEILSDPKHRAFAEHVGALKEIHRNARMPQGAAQ